MEYFHINYPSVDLFVGRLQTRLRCSSSALLRQRLAGWRADVHGEAAEAVVTKIKILNLVLSRLNSEVIALVAYLKTVPDAAEKCIVNRLAICIPDNELHWQLSADVEAFLVEARSVYELLGKFLRHFFHLIFQRSVTQEQIISAVKSLGVDVSWFPVLKDSRDLFVHSAASLLAVERISNDPPEFDLVLLKRSVEPLNDGDYLRFRDLRTVQKELSKSVTRVAVWIENEINAVEAEERPFLDAIE